MLLEVSKHHFSSQLRSQQSTSALMGLEWSTAGQSGQEAKQPGVHFPKVLAVPSLPASSQQGQERPPAPGVLPQGCYGNNPCESCLSQLVLLWKGGLVFFFFTWKFGTATKKIFPRLKYYLFLPSYSKLLFSTSSLENPADFKGIYLVSSIFQEKDFDYMVVWAQEALEMSSISAFTPFLLLRVHIPLFFTCDSLANMTLIVIGKWLSLWIVKLFSLNNIASIALIRLLSPFITEQL